MKVINKKPFLHYLLKSIENFEFSSIHFCLGYKSEKIIPYLQTIGKNISYTVEDDNNLLGTGGAIKNCLEFLEKDFIVQYGDTILKLDYDHLFQIHLSSNKKMTMTILDAKLTKEKPNIYCKNINGHSKSFIYSKKSELKDANFIDYGALVFKRSVFEKKFKNKFQLSEIQEHLTKSYQSEFLEVFYPYLEIGTPQSYNEATKKLNDL